MTKITLDPHDPAILGRLLCLFHVRLKGEDRNILSLFQSFVGALSGRPAIIVVKGRTRGGKSRLVKTVIAPYKKIGLVLDYSRVTQTFLEHLAMQYWAKSKQPEKKKEEEGNDVKPQRILVDIPERILFIDEIRGASQTTEPIKINFSEGRIKLGTVIKNRPVEIELRGIKVVVTTTTSASFADPEFENRTLPLQIDESTEQTGRILDHEADEGERLEEDDDEDEAWLNGLEVEAIADFVKRLQPVRVSIPFTHELAKQFPRKNVFERGEFPKIKRFIRNLATIHQYQRVKIRDKQKLLVGIAADPIDWQYLQEIGLPSFKESFTGISEKEQKIYDILKGGAPAIVVKKSTGTLDQEEAEYAWTVRNLAPKTEFGRRGEDTLRKLLQRMTDDGYVFEDQSKGKPYRYSVTELEPEAFNLTLTKYTADGLDKWASTRGYEITGKPQTTSVYYAPATINNATSPLSNILKAAEPNGVESCRDTPSQHETLPLAGMQQGMAGNEHLAPLTPENNQATMVPRQHETSGGPWSIPWWGQCCCTLCPHQDSDSNLFDGKASFEEHVSRHCEIWREPPEEPPTSHMARRGVE